MDSERNYGINSSEGRDVAFHFHPYTNPTNLEELGPHIISKGEGIYVLDKNDRKYIEGMSGLWCASLGFNEPELIEAAIGQMKKLPFYHSFTGKVSDPAIELAEKLISIAPKGLKKAFFCKVLNDLRLFSMEIC